MTPLSAAETQLPRSRPEPAEFGPTRTCSQPDAVGTLITERPPHRTVRAAFPHTACMGLSLSRAQSSLFRSLSFFVPFFGLTRAASILPSRPQSFRPSRAGAVKVGRRANLTPRSILARPHLDGGEHGGNLPAIGPKRCLRPSEGSPPWPCGERTSRACIRLDPFGILTMKQSSASVAGLRGGGSILLAALQP